MKKSDYSFTQPYIKESFFKLNTGFQKNPIDSIGLSTKVKFYTDYQSGENNNFSVCGLIVEVGEESEELPFFVKVVMEAEFSWKDKTEKEIDRFLKVNAPSLLAGYIRPIITFLTANSPYSPFNLSFINFSE